MIEHWAWLTWMEDYMGFKTYIAYEGGRGLGTSRLEERASIGVVKNGPGHAKSPISMDLSRIEYSRGVSTCPC